MSAAAVLDKARALGVALPTFTIFQAPEHFTAWADRVAQADSLRHAGRLTAADLDECDRQLGIAATRAIVPTPPGQTSRFLETLHLTLTGHGLYGRAPKQVAA